MKDSTRAALKDGVSGLLTLFVIGTLLVLGTSGCATAHEQHAHKRSTVKPANNWRPGARCKQLGKAMTTHVAVLVEKNCLRNGLTTVNMVILNKEKKGTVAGEHAVQAVTSILGFKPKMKILFYGKMKGKLLVMAAVSGVTPDTIASRR